MTVVKKKSQSTKICIISELIRTSSKGNDKILFFIDGKGRNSEETLRGRNQKKKKKSNIEDPGKCLPQSIF